MTRRYALRDDQWERIKDLLPGRKGTVGVTTKDNRLFVKAVLYRYPCRHSLAGLTRTIWRFPGGSHPFQSMGKARRVATGI
jgi:transposase